MNSLINKEFLEKNCFEEAKIGCGYFPWCYEDKECIICVALWTDSCRCYIAATNYLTNESLTLEHKSMNKLTKNDFKRVMDFLDIKLDFDYE